MKSGKNHQAAAPIFQRIGLLSKYSNQPIIETLQTLLRHLVDQNLAVTIEASTAELLPGPAEFNTAPYHNFAQDCDLVIVVGGDGSLLHAAHAVVEHNIPILGVNRGRLGFLTDILPQDLITKVDEVLAGGYTEEPRFLLTAGIQRQGNLFKQDALNDVVLMPGDTARMIEFEITIDKQFVCSQRADGLIVATPTGSTAYALSGGGPIIHPQLNALVLVPMFPHTLSSRPIVVSADSKIDIHIAIDCQPYLSCDGYEKIAIQADEHIEISKKPQALRLLHPLNYNYFETLRSKLHWGQKL